MKYKTYAGGSVIRTVETIFSIYFTANTNFLGIWITLDTKLGVIGRDRDILISIDRDIDIESAVETV